jgi:1,4-dihydroxy-2-naphthoate octaprenyltransferase
LADRLGGQLSSESASSQEESNAVATSVSSPAPPPSRVTLLIRATRPPALLSSLVPCLAGGLLAINSGRARWGLLAVALVAMLFLHAGVNSSNDVEDAARGVDGPDKLRNSGVFNTGQLSLGEGRRFYAACFGLAFGLGLVICAIQGPALLVIGTIGILGGLLYTAGPWPYKNVGLGEPLIVLLMGPLITQGAYTAVTGDAFAAQALWLGAGPGLLIAAVLSANNLEDIQGDAAAGLHTVAVRLGFARSQRLYVATLGTVALAPCVLWLSGLYDAWILLPLLVAPLLVARSREALSATAPGDRVLDQLTDRTGQVHVLFCLLLCVAAVLARTL